MYILLALLCLFTNAFFVASEFALVGARKSKIELLRQQGNKNAAKVKEVCLRLDACLSSCQVGITLSSLALGWVGEAAFAIPIKTFLHELSIYDAFPAHMIASVSAFTVVTFLHVVLGELAPKSVALQYPEKSSLIIVTPMIMVNWFFYPLVIILNHCSFAFLSLFGLRPTKEQHTAISQEEYFLMLEESKKAGILDQDEQIMLRRVFSFHDQIVKNIMTPSIDIIAVAADSSIHNAWNVMMESGYSRILVYEGNQGSIVGSIYLKDLIKLVYSRPDADLKKLIRPILQVSENSKISDLLKSFQEKHLHIAIAIDEFGNTAGLITFEDALEEIVGDIQDEYDNEADLYQKIKDGTYRFAGKLPVQTLLKVFPDFTIPQGDFLTIAGLILFELKRMPHEKEGCQIGNLYFEILKKEGPRIKQVMVSIKKPS